MDDVDGFGDVGDVGDFGFNFDEALFGLDVLIDQ